MTMVMMQPEPQRNESPAREYHVHHHVRIETEAERQRLVREHERLVESHYAYVQDQWKVFQKVKHDAPPTLLPLEASRELKGFRTFLQQETVRNLEQTAIDRFETEVRSQAQEAEQVVA